MIFRERGLYFILRICSAAHWRIMNRWYFLKSQLIEYAQDIGDSHVLRTRQGRLALRILH